MNKPNKVLKTSVLGKVVQHIGWSGSGCHGHQNIYPLIEIPGWDLPPGTEVRVEITTTILKRGKTPSKKCENPWPSHFCEDGKHRGAFGKLKRVKKS